MDRFGREYREERRAKAITYLGSECVDCGNDDARVLEFDHVTERRNNGRSVATYLSGWWKWERVVLELDKCVLRCANCHKIKTAGEPRQVNGYRNQFSPQLLEEGTSLVAS